MKISKNKKMRFFLMSQGSLNQKIRFLDQKVCPVDRSQQDTQTEPLTVTLSGFQDFFLQAIIKDWPNRALLVQDCLNCFTVTTQKNIDHSMDRSYLHVQHARGVTVKGTSSSVHQYLLLPIQSYIQGCTFYLGFRTKHASLTPNMHN